MLTANQSRDTDGRLYPEGSANVRHRRPQQAETVFYPSHGDKSLADRLKRELGPSHKATVIVLLRMRTVSVHWMGWIGVSKDLESCRFGSDGAQE